jgi:hypothetical protein
LRYNTRGENMEQFIDNDSEVGDSGSNLSQFIVEPLVQIYYNSLFSL